MEPAAGRQSSVASMADDTPTPAGPETPEEVAAMLAEVDAETAAAADPAWQAAYGKNLAGYTRSLFE